MGFRSWHTHEDQSRAWDDMCDCSDRVKEFGPSSAPIFATHRLLAENSSGISSTDIEKSIIKEAEAEGRELARPSDYGY